MWNEILAEPDYDDVDNYPTGAASRLYARGLAYASLGMVAEAEAEQVSENITTAPAIRRPFQVTQAVGMIPTCASMLGELIVLSQLTQMIAACCVGGNQPLRTTKSEAVCIDGDPVTRRSWLGHS